MLGTDETPEMTRARELYPIQSKQTYAGVAKAALAKSHVAAGAKLYTRDFYDYFNKYIFIENYNKEFIKQQ